MIDRTRTSFSSLVELLEFRAGETPEGWAFGFLKDGEGEPKRITYRELAERARAIGQRLQESGMVGERAVLLYPPGLEFITAFFGCLYAGTIAVPAYPPRTKKEPERLLAVIADAQPKAALTQSPLAKRLQGQAKALPLLRRMSFLATDTLDSSSAAAWSDPEVRADDIAFLQYTSGSTSTPKGVIVSHGNLLHNSALIQQSFGLDEHARIVGWLPLYHDMGLIGNVLQPLYLGVPCVLMSPGAFLRDPSRWLKAISRFRATTSGGPNFAYDLCARRVSPKVKATLDLSRWTVAFNGAEPIRAATLDRFSAAFADCGFRREAFYPCYGLAEGTLLVSGADPLAAPEVLRADSAALEEGLVAEENGSAGTAEARSLVGSGQARRQTVVIVDPKTGRSCSPGRVGEIWVSGPSVAQGYWGRPEESEETFNARLAEQPGRDFLRTGDLGFLRGDELFITGRTKDLIILRGRNLYPQDIELTVESSAPGLRPGGSAAFGVPVDGEERLVIVQEVDRGTEIDPEEVGRRVREAVAREHQAHVHDLVLIQAGSLSKTSSGKVRRHACRLAWAEGKLATVGRSSLHEGATEESDQPSLTAETLRALDPEDRRVLLGDHLRSLLAGLLKAEVANIDPRQPFAALGLDSLMTLELSYALEDRLGVSISTADLLSAPSLEAVAESLSDELGRPSAQMPGPIAGRQNRETAPLSFGQRALWFIQRLAPRSGAYNLIATGRFLPRESDAPSLDLEALERAVAALTLRHPSLRTTFPAPDGQPIQLIQRQLLPELLEEDLSSHSEEEVELRLRELAYRPFDLGSGPLWRLAILRHPTYAGGGSLALLVTHHIVSDFWSLTVMLQDLGQLYRQETSSEGGAGDEAGLTPLELAYADWVDWQESLLAGSRGEALWQYWHRQLTGAPSQLDLPFDRQRPPVQTYRGGARRVRLSRDLATRLEAFGSHRGATLYMTLLAGFQAVLYRYSHQEDLTVGSPSLGRPTRDLRSLVGYFVNPLVLRGDLSGRPSFEALLGRVRGTVLEAFEHQDYPFALLTERLHPVRDPSRSPLFQVMFSFQRAASEGLRAMDAFALGEGGAVVDAGGLRLESIPFEARQAPFDLTLSCARLDGGLTLSAQYNRDLFDGSTVERLLGHYEELLRGAVADAARPLRALPILGESERFQLLSELNDTALTITEERWVHRPFEARCDEAPESVAVIFEDRETTYGELERQSNRLAHLLREVGVRCGEPVGIHLRRSPDLLVAILGILKAGAAYLPLDPDYPRERLAFMLEDSGSRVVVSVNGLESRLDEFEGVKIRLDGDAERLAGQVSDRPEINLGPTHPAYLIYTSGSTGRPKGVRVPHGAVVNFFAAMDQRVGCGPEDILLAATSISFDISVLELCWTLARGAKVVLLGEQSAALGGSAEAFAGSALRPLDLSLFYFAGDGAAEGSEKYRLLLEGARFADREGLKAVWTPERHFHAFGGLFANPAVTGAAVAAATAKVEIRAGSVVLPLHDPIRVAEEWSMVDNLSGGRVGIALASGWHADDFVFFPGKYPDRREEVYEDLVTVQRLWRGDAVTAKNGAGREIEVRILPRPVQKELPIWITSAFSEETFIRAGSLGANVLTHLLGQTVEEVGEKVRIYREARAAAGHDPATGIVTLMLHTFLGEDREEVREKVRGPFTEYLRTSVGLIRNLVKSLDRPLDLDRLSPKDMNDLLAFAFDRYFSTAALFGTVDDALTMASDLQSIGVDEVACLVDFGVDEGEVLASLPKLAELGRRCAKRAEEAARLQTFSLTAQARRHRPTLFQCTPSMVRMLSLDEAALGSLESLRTMLVGGEALPPDLARKLDKDLPARLINVYGPTETTVWSTSYEVAGAAETVPIGHPLVNTEVHLADSALELVPLGVSGELFIGGDGVTSGYHRRPGLTAQRFLPDPFGHRAGGRLYRTGDLARRLEDGTLDFLGRTDQQVKIRGFRIELGEVESHLADHPQLREAAVVVRGADDADPRLVAYVVPAAGDPRDAPGPSEPPTVDALRAFLAVRMPEYMVPSQIVFLEDLPRTPNRKVDRSSLPDPEVSRPDLATTFVAPGSRLEKEIAAIWMEALEVDRVGLDDNFFDLGGHSLLMAQVHSQLRERLGVELPLVRLLEHPTVGALARALGKGANGGFDLERSRGRAQRQRSSRGRRSRQRTGGPRPERTAPVGR